MASLLTLMAGFGTARAQDPKVASEPKTASSAPRASTSAGVQPIPARQLRYQSLTVARLNPLGLISVLDGSHRWRLFESNSPVANNNFIGIGGRAVLSPAFFRIGPTLEIQPLSILTLSVTYDAVDYFNSFDFFQSFDSANADFSDTALDDRSASQRPAIDSYATNGTQVTLQGVFRFKMGPVAVRDTFRAGWGDYELREGDRVYYDPVWDLLIADENWFINNDLDVLYLTDFGLKLGVRWTMATAFYDDEDFAEGASTEDPNNPTHRVGPFVAYTFKSTSRVFKDPTLIFIANWWVQHRFRTGEDVTTALPYIILGLRFDGDIWSSRNPG